MKNFYLLIFKTIVISIMVVSCKKITDIIDTKCRDYSTKNYIILADLSDSKLTSLINSDLSEKTNTFYQKISINPCEKINFLISPIGEDINLGKPHVLDLNNFIIDRTDKNENKVSKKNKALRDTIPLLVQKEFDKIQVTQEATSSRLGNNILKTILKYSKDSETKVIVISDMVENSEYLDMYKNNFQTINTQDAISKIFDPELLTKLKDPSTKNNIKRVNLILDIKPDSGNKVKIRDVKQFWIKIFDQLQIPYQITDNLDI